MKIYNPFKAHYCRFGDGRYGVRKLSLRELGWMYFDTNDMKFWLVANFRGSRHDSLGALKSLLAEHQRAADLLKNRNKSRRVE